MEYSNRKKVKEKILKSVAAALDSAEDQYDAASEKSSEIIGAIKEKAGSAYDDAKEKAQLTREKTVDYVHDNPEKSLLMAAGIGALTALILSKFMKKR